MQEHRHTSKIALKHTFYQIQNKLVQLDYMITDFLKMMVKVKVEISCLIDYFCNPHFVPALFSD